MGIEQSEPMVHYIASNTEEATDVIKRLLTIDTSIGLEEGVLARVQSSTTGLNTVGHGQTKQYTSANDLDSRHRHPQQHIYRKDVKLGTPPQDDRISQVSTHSQAIQETKFQSDPLFGTSSAPNSLYLRKPQVEIQGHIFVDRQRIFRRSVLPLMIFGIMARPYDLGWYFAKHGH
jgi:hypothetical protein